jgi:hypothetical protein
MVELPKKWGQDHEAIIAWTTVRNRKMAEEWYREFCPQFTTEQVKSLLDRMERNPETCEKLEFTPLEKLIMNDKLRGIISKNPKS